MPESAKRMFKSLMQRILICPS